MTARPRTNTPVAPSRFRRRHPPSVAIQARQVLPPGRVPRNIKYRTAYSGLILAARITFATPWHGPLARDVRRQLYSACWLIHVHFFNVCVSRALTPACFFDHSSTNPEAASAGCAWGKSRINQRAIKLAVSGVALRFQCLDAIGVKADIARASRACRSEAIDPTPVIGWIEIPQCSGLPPRRDVLSFRSSTGGAAAPVS